MKKKYMKYNLFINIWNYVTTMHTPLPQYIRPHQVSTATFAILENK